MKTYNNLYSKIVSYENLLYAWRKARKGKTKKKYVIEFEKDLEMNLMDIREELLSGEYFPKPLITFVLRDPKTRVISKSDFRDRIVHHALCIIIEPIFDKTFIYDSCANRIGKGTLFALKRFEYFKRKVTNNLTSEAFCLKADVKHYFQEVDCNILRDIIGRRIRDKKVLELIRKILVNKTNICASANFGMQRERERVNLVLGEALGQSPTQGMPLGNLTSQFFANVYLNELDYFVKHELKAKYYIRYVDDFIILDKSKEMLEELKDKIDKFLGKELKLELHPQKLKIISLSYGIDFVGFRNFYHYKLLRKRNLRNILKKVKDFQDGKINYNEMMESFCGWNAYAEWGNALKLRREIAGKIAKINNKIIS